MTSFISHEHPDPRGPAHLPRLHDVPDVQHRRRRRSRTQIQQGPGAPQLREVPLPAVTDLPVRLSEALPPTFASLSLSPSRSLPVSLPPSRASRRSPARLPVCISTSSSLPPPRSVPLPAGGYLSRTPPWREGYLSRITRILAKC
jgi:hypothetical protein